MFSQMLSFCCILQNYLDNPISRKAADLMCVYFFVCKGVCAGALENDFLLFQYTPWLQILRRRPITHTAFFKAIFYILDTDISLAGFKGRDLHFTDWKCVSWAVAYF